MAGSLRLTLHQLAHCLGEMRDVLSQGGQIRGEVSGSVFSVRGMAISNMKGPAVVLYRRVWCAPRITGQAWWQDSGATICK